MGVGVGVRGESYLRASGEDPRRDGESAEHGGERRVRQNVGVVDLVNLEEEVLGGVGGDEAFGQHALKAGAVRLIQRVGLLLAHAQVCRVRGD